MTSARAIASTALLAAVVLVSAGGLCGHWNGSYLCGAPDSGCTGRAI